MTAIKDVTQLDRAINSITKDPTIGEMNKLKIELFDKSHDKKRFDCGIKELNVYLQTMASQHAKKGISRTYVLIDENFNSIILGYITLSSYEIISDALPKQFAKKYPLKIPGAKIGRLAISRKKQRQGLGELLMLFAMNQALLVYKTIGLTGMIVDAKNEQLQKYYEAYGFIPLPEAPLTLFLPMKSILESFKD